MEVLSGLMLKADGGFSKFTYQLYGLSLLPDKVSFPIHTCHSSSELSQTLYRYSV
jgi:hypothetical protein